MKGIRLFQKSIILLMAYLLLIPALPQPVVEVTRLASTVQAAEDNFIYYRDIVFEAGRGDTAIRMTGLSLISLPSRSPILNLIKLPKE